MRLFPYVLVQWQTLIHRTYNFKPCRSPVPACTELLRHESSCALAEFNSGSTPERHKRSRNGDYSSVSEIPPELIS